jgi:branched-chain amino acid transport system ATP-binding protein
MMAVAGVLDPRRGRFLFDGRDITQEPSHLRARHGITLVPEGRRVFPFMSVQENLEMGAFSHRRDRRKVRALLAEVYDLFPVLADRSAQNAGTLSGGEQQMLAIGRARMSSPRLLCLDEPSLGLAPLIVRHIFDTIRQINEAGTTILLVEQNAQYALRTAHRGYVLQTGSVIFSGTTEELRQDERVKEAYLGRGVEV